MRYNKNFRERRTVEIVNHYKPFICINEQARRMQHATRNAKMIVHTLTGMITLVLICCLLMVIYYFAATRAETQRVINSSGPQIEATTREALK